MKYDPYGTHEDRQPIADVFHRVYQGETVKLYFVLPDDVASFNKAEYRFVVTDDRFKRTYLFEASDEHFSEVDTPESAIKVLVTIPSEITQTFRRGSFLYSMEWKAILGDDRRVLEEGNLLVEYQAGAPDPDVPYKTQNDDQDGNQNYG